MGPLLEAAAFESILGMQFFGTDFVLSAKEGKLPYRTIFKRHVKRLDLQLKRAKVSRAIRERIIASGYMLWDGPVPAFKIGRNIEVVQDGLYGTKWGFGFIPFDQFVDWAHRMDRIPLNARLAPTYVVSSLQEAEGILSKPPHGHYWKQGRMCFRGQTREYFIKRSFPNLAKRDAQGRERLIIPSFWRRHIANITARPFRDPPTPLLTSSGAGDLVYHDFPNWRSLEERRRRDYPQLDVFREIVFSHNEFGLDKFRAENQELFPLPRFLAGISDREMAQYLGRWVEISVRGHLAEEDTLIEQHYGLETCGLDVTFDLPTAAFFATTRFRSLDATKNIATYENVSPGEHEGVIYCFVFEDPPVHRTSDMIQQISMFSTLSPTRPIRQSCALPYFSSENFNEAATELSAILYISNEFQRDGLQSKEYLFPDVENDPFYAKLLELKNGDSGRAFGAVVEYQFY